MQMNLAIGLAMVFVALILFALLKGTKLGKSKHNQVMLILGAIGVSGILIAGNIIPISSEPLTIVSPGEQETVYIPTGQASDDVVTYTFNQRNLYAKSTAVTGGGWMQLLLADKGSSDYYIYDDSGSDNLIEPGSSIGLPPGTKYKVLASENSTTASTGAYVSVKEGVVGNVGEIVYLDVTQFDSSPTITLYDEDGIPITSTNNQSMSASNNYDLGLKIRASNDQCIGNILHPGKGNVMCLQYNTTIINTVEINGQPKAPTPNNLDARSGFTQQCFYLPPVCDGDDDEYRLYVETASGEPYAQDNQLNMTLWDTDVDVDADTLELIYDIEDEDNNDMGFADYIASSNVYIS